MRPEFMRALDLAFLFLSWFVHSFGKSYESPSFQKRIRLDAATRVVAKGELSLGPPREVGKPTLE